MSLFFSAIWMWRMINYREDSRNVFVIIIILFCVNLCGQSYFTRVFFFCNFSSNLLVIYYESIFHHLLFRPQSASLPFYTSCYYFHILLLIRCHMNVYCSLLKVSIKFLFFTGSYLMFFFFFWETSSHSEDLHSWLVKILCELFVVWPVAEKLDESSISQIHARKQRKTNAVHLHPRWWWLDLNQMVLDLNKIVTDLH